MSALDTDREGETGEGEAEDELSGRLTVDCVGVVWDETSISELPHFNDSKTPVFEGSFGVSNAGEDGDGVGVLLSPKKISAVSLAGGDPGVEGPLARGPETK